MVCRAPCPVSPVPVCKVQQGWVKVVDVAGPAQACTIMDVKKGDRSVYRIDIKTDGSGASEWKGMQEKVCQQ